MKLLIGGMMMMAALLPTPVLARGGGHSGGSVHVSGYTRANGTYVHDYYRSAPGMSGTGDSASAVSSRGSTNNLYEGLGRGEGDVDSSSASIGSAGQPSKPKCEYKAVMTDEEIARCR